MYGTEYIRKTNLKTEFTISDLTAGIDYEIYFYLMNMNLVNNPTYTKIAFSTLSKRIQMTCVFVFVVGIIFTFFFSSSHRTSEYSCVYAKTILIHCHFRH